MGKSWNIAKWLYIPHSSDKTIKKIRQQSRPKTFTSHIVQIKPYLDSVHCEENKDFTSHIVQIKPAGTGHKCIVQFNLYIPHSSDKTIYTYLLTKTKKMLYIPHSSDKTLLNDLAVIRCFYLYIPHSSDKTKLNTLLLLRSFISLHPT